MKSRRSFVKDLLGAAAVAAVPTRLSRTRLPLRLAIPWTAFEAPSGVTIRELEGKPLEVSFITWPGKPRGLLLLDYRRRLLVHGLSGTYRRSFELARDVGAYATISPVRTNLVQTNGGYVEVVFHLERERVS